MGQEAVQEAPQKGQEGILGGVTHPPPTLAPGVLLAASVAVAPQPTQRRPKHISFSSFFQCVFESIFIRCLLAKNGARDGENHVQYRHKYFLPSTALHCTVLYSTQDRNLFDS